jgi:hypothetical protein
VTLEILVNGLSRQLCQVELYQGMYSCERVATVAVVEQSTHLDEDSLVGRPSACSTSLPGRGITACGYVVPCDV